jgi:putative PIN family toxin of toxin-antitoxin system
MTRIINGKDKLLVSNEILQELFFVLSRPKFNVSNNQVIHFINSIEEVAYHVPTMGTIQGICRDSDDDKILECAFMGDADFIVSGDNDLLSLKEFQEIPVLTASEYLDEVEN